VHLRLSLARFSAAYKPASLPSFFALVPSFSLDQYAGFQETRKHTSASDVISRDGKCVSGNASVENSSVRSACFTPKRASYRAPGNPFYHLELAKGFEPPTL
jgi:hypothetical protein